MAGLGGEGVGEVISLMSGGRVPGDNSTAAVLAGGGATRLPPDRKANQTALPAKIVTPAQISSTAQAPNQRQAREGVAPGGVAPGGVCLFIVGGYYPSLPEVRNLREVRLQ